MSNGVLHIPAGKAFLLLEEQEQRIGISAIDLYLLETGEFRTEVQLAELMDRLVGAGSLLAKLVAGEIENLETLAVIVFIKFFQLVVLGRETALGSCIDNQQHLVGILFQ